MVGILSKEEEELINRMTQLKYKESQTQLFANLLSLICPLSIIAISIASAYNESNPFRLLLILVYPLSIMAMSINRKSKGVFSYIPLFILVWISIYALNATLPVVLCMLGITASYHMIFNALPLIRLELNSIEKSPLYPEICNKIIKYKMNKKS